REAMTSIVRDVRIVNPAGKDNDGSIELLEFEGYTGRDFSSRAVPPNLGNLMLRFPVPDVDALARYLAGQGIKLEYQPIATTLAPYGKVKLMAIRAPDGAWLEFFQAL
ncbi:MAG: VOC family protein, partial [Pseudomonadota bacterium]